MEQDTQSVFCSPGIAEGGMMRMRGEERRYVPKLNGIVTINGLNVPRRIRCRSSAFLSSDEDDIYNRSDRQKHVQG